MSTHVPIIGDLLPSGSTIIRLTQNPKIFFDDPDRKERPNIIIPAMFNLSKLEKNGSRKLSVYDCELTTPQEARDLMENSNRYQMVLWLSVDRLRSIEIKIGDGPCLEVVRHEKTVSGISEGVHIPDHRAGASGHAGIVGLDDGSIPNSGHRLLARTKLCEIATATWI